MNTYEKFLGAVPGAGSAEATCDSRSQERWVGGGESDCCQSWAGSWAGLECCTDHDDVTESMHSRLFLPGLKVPDCRGMV